MLLLVNPERLSRGSRAMTDPAQSETTQLLIKLRCGEIEKAEATNRLFDLVYDHLHRLASRFMRGERPGHTLQTTALINEAYLHMVDGSCIDWKDRAHFIGIAARVMRRVLVAHARRRMAEKRGGGWRKITLGSDLGFDLESHTELLDLDRVMTKLSEEDPRAADVVDMRVFGGMEVTEVGHILGVSERTIYKDWHFAKLWLSKELAEGERP
jgi:RNA polymerase sigma factor (TIGR02999 family)